MLGLILLLASQSTPEVPGLWLAATVEIPQTNKYSQSLGAVPATAPSHSIAFGIPIDTPRMGSIVLRFDAVTKKFEQLPGDYGFQEDCDNGLVNTAHLVEDPKTRLWDANSATTYDVGTGRKLSDVPTSIERVGRLGIERYKPMQSGAPGNRRPRVFDLTTGKVLATIGRQPNDEGYIGKIVWDDPRIRFTSVNSRQIEGKRREGVTLYRCRGPLFARELSVEITDMSLGFDRIIGNPENEFFTAMYSSNRRAYFKTLTRDLKPTPFQLGKVQDVSNNGVLGRKILKELDYGYTEDGPVGCWNPMSGKQIWITDSEGSSQWLGDYALVGDTIRRANDGSVYAKLPSGRRLIAARGDTIWMMTDLVPRRLEVWKIRRG